jgi:Kef-type K+ transport system membrane component KefB
MRRALTLLLLLLGMQMIEPLGRYTPSSAVLLVFGFLILAAQTVGEVGRSVGLPKFVGYMIAGMLFGPAVLDLVTHESIIRLGPVSDLAIALIAFMAGAELKWQDLRLYGRQYLRILASEMGLTFLAMFGTVIALHFMIASLVGATWQELVVFGLLFAAVAIAHSPAATLALLSETRASGPVARTALGVVLMSDVALIVLFTIVATISRLILPPTGLEHLPSLGLITWEIAGAVVVGAAMGGAVALYMRFATRELLLFGIIVAMFGAEIARLAHVELLLTLLVAGFVTENASGARGELLKTAVERASAPLFVVFFALAGASIDLKEVAALGLLLIPLVLVRMGALYVGTAIGTRGTGIGEKERRHLWSGLVAQAGVAIGLATALADVFPTIGVEIKTLALALIAVNQVIGPVIFRRALVAAGEIEAQITRGQPAIG